MTNMVPHIGRLARFSLTTADANRAAAFYEAAFGCRTISSDRLSGTDFEHLMGVRGGATRIVLALGREIIELLQFDKPGAPYPAASSSCDLSFQHFAIVVADIDQAYSHLLGIEGWSRISLGGPQRLPESSGGVTAFKFRDPEGHPLELLAFPAGANTIWSAVQRGSIFLGIDHSAIVVSDSSASIAFYEGFGFRATGGSLNRGPEQECLDDVRGALVEVSALAPLTTHPHLELLSYRSHRSASTPALRSNDIACTRLVFEIADQAALTYSRQLRDPDGHALVIAASDARRSTSGTF
jgi:catechol 2,3-dioxygenase-like lactoylglutathione lyase family enzyme